MPEEKQQESRKIRCPRCKEFYTFSEGIPPKDCPECSKKRLAQIEHVRKLIRENRGISAMELNRQTGVPVSFIMKMVNDGDIEQL